MLEIGSSQPWQQAYKIITGNEQVDASAILDYFASLPVRLKIKIKVNNAVFNNDLITTSELV